MSARPPFALTDPERLAGALVFSSPHSGRDYPPDLVGRTRLNLRGLRASEDAFVDRLYASAPLHGAPLIAACAPRAWLDLNRAPGELDPALIEGVRPHGLNQRVAAGLGVVPRVVSEGQAIYRGKIPLAEAEARIEAIHRPYHAALSSLLHRARERFGWSLLLDCHSMPTEALRAAPRVRGRVPEIVLGDRFGASAARVLVTQTQKAFERAGFIVARNTPFAGGYITQLYGRPASRSHAIQIEIDRGLYLDQERIEPGPRFAEIAARLSEVIAELMRVNSGTVGIAAE